MSVTKQMSHACKQYVKKYDKNYHVAIHIDTLPNISCDQVSKTGCVGMLNTNLIGYNS